MSDFLQTYDTDQPWVCYTYGLMHDQWWPPLTSTRVRGFTRIQCDCCVCGQVEILKIPIERIGKVKVPKSGKHPARERYLAAHAHPDRGHPMSWARPLRNVAAHQGGLDLDLLGMRLEDEIRREHPDTED